MSGLSLALSLGSEESRKTGIVRTGDLIAGYSAMNDARAAFEERQKELVGGVDTLKADYRQTVNTLNADWKGLTNEEQESRTQLLKAQEQNLMRYTQNLEAYAQAEGEQLLDSVLTQVNDAVKIYAEEHGYDVILGATSNGSILYGTDVLDITDELIDALNENYETNRLHSENTVQ